MDLNFQVRVYINFAILFNLFFHLLISSITLNSFLEIIFAIIIPAWVYFLLPMTCLFDLFALNPFF